MARCVGMINAPVSDQMAIRAVGYYTRYGGFVDAVGPAGGENINSGHRVGGRFAVRLEPGAGITITPRIVYQETEANGFNRQEVYNLYSNAFTNPPRVYDERQQYLLLRESFRDRTFLADLNVSVDLGDAVLTSISSYVNRDITVSRDASALTGSVSVDLGYPAAGVNLPSNLVDTTDLETFTQELRLATESSGPINMVLGVFYGHTERFYTQRLPTPGYDAFTDATLGAGTAAATRNGFPANSPYNADLPYAIDQYALFGEATWDLSQTLHLTFGGRYYDFSETRSFISGGLFSNLDNRVDETSSNGFSPRLILSWEAADNIRINAQASKGFRLGGVNDPLNIILCTGGANGVDAMTYGNRPTYEDETLWNYEIGVRGRRSGVNFSAAAFYTDIRNLQVTADAGTCSSRVVFNVPSAHTMGIEFGALLHAGRGSERLDQWQHPGSRVRLRRDHHGRRHYRRHPRGQQVAVGAEVPALRERELRIPDRRRCAGLFRGLLPACRQPLHTAERPGEQPAHLRARPAVQRAAGQCGDRPGPEAAVLRLCQPVGRDRLGQRLRGDDLRHQPVRRERPALVRPRARRPGAAGLQHRPAPDDRHHAPQALRQLTDALTR